MSKIYHFLPRKCFNLQNSQQINFLLGKSVVFSDFPVVSYFAQIEFSCIVNVPFNGNKVRKEIPLQIITELQPFFLRYNFIFNYAFF
jgi:hypothetical protein